MGEHVNWKLKKIKDEDMPLEIYQVSSDLYIEHENIMIVCKICCISARWFCSNRQTDSSNCNFINPNVFLFDNVQIIREYRTRL